MDPALNQIREINRMRLHWARTGEPSGPPDFICEDCGNENCRCSEIICSNCGDSLAHHPERSACGASNGKDEEGIKDVCPCEGFEE